MSHWDSALIAAIGAAIVLTMMANVCVIVIVINNKRMRSSTNVMISNLAVSDLLLGCIVLPQNLHDASHSGSNFYEGIVSCKLVNALPIFCIFCSIYTMVAMSFERYQAIACMPPRIMTPQWTRSVIAAIWVVAVIGCIPTLVEYQIYTDPETGSREGVMRREASYNNSTRPTGHTIHLWHDQDASTIMSINDDVRITAWQELVTSEPLQEVTSEPLKHAQHNMVCGSDSAPRLLSLINAVGLFLAAYLVPTCLTWVNYSKVIRFIITHSKQIRADPAIVTVATAPQTNNVGVGSSPATSYRLHSLASSSLQPPHRENYNSRSRISPPSTPASTIAPSVMPSTPAFKMSASFRRKVKAVKMLVAIAALFQICWLPYFTILLYTKYTGQDDSQQADGVSNYLRIILSVFSVSYNAVLYVICNPMFRMGFKNILCLGRGRLHNSTVFPVHVTRTLSSSPPKGPATSRNPGSMNPQHGTQNALHLGQ